MKVLAAALLCTLLAACAAPVPSVTAPSPDLHLSNGTALTVTLVVDGQRVADVAPGGTAGQINVAALPPLPWILEARSPSGRVLAALQVPVSEGQTDASIGQVVDLSCGRLWLWVGDITPDAPVASPGGQPGDCAP